MTLQKKFEQAARATDRYTDIIVKDRVYAAYKQSLDTVRKQTATLYEKHAKDGILSMSEVSKYNRLGNLEKDIAAEMTRLGGKQVRATTKAIKDVYQESAYRTAYALNTEMPDIALNFGLLPTKQVEGAILNPMDRIGWPGRTHEQIAIANRQVRETITQGIIQGKPYPDMARDIKERFDMAAYKAERIVRTEAHRARSMGQLATLEEAHEQGVDMKKVWITAMDGRVRDSHGAMDRQDAPLFDEEGNPGKFTSGAGNTAEAPGMFNIAKEDINCRCAMRGEVPGYEPTERRERLTEEEYQARKAAEAERAAKENRDPLPIARSEVKPYRTYPEYAKEKGFPSLYKGAEPRMVGAVAESVAHKTSKQWMDSLTSEQQEAVDGWIRNDYTEIRKYQITGSGDDIIEAKVKRLNNAIDNAPQYDGKTYRGLGELDQDVYDGMLNSKTITLDAHSSSSMNREIAEEFAATYSKKKGILMEIQSKTGRDISALDPSGIEQEVLFKKGTKFKVVGYEEGKDMGQLTKLILQEM